MKQIEFVLVLVVGILSASAYRYQLPGRQIVSKILRKRSLLTETQVTFVCHDDGLFPNPEDCSKYINCSNGVAYELSCPPSRHFNNGTKQCEIPCSAKCDATLAEECGWEDTKEFTFETAFEDFCSKCDTHTLQSLFRCEKYLTCNGSLVTVHRCPDGQHFNQEIAGCELPCDARCDLSLAEQCGWEDTTESDIGQTTLTSIAEGLTLSGSTESFNKDNRLNVVFICYDDGLFPNPKDCSKYINCLNGNAYDLSCPPSRHFNNETKQCETLCSAKCDPNLICDWQDSKKKFEEAFEDICNNTDEKYATQSPYYCDIYYKCEAGEINKFSCPHRQHFQKNFKRGTFRCTEPCNARCDSSLAEECGWEDRQPFDFEAVVEDFCSKRDKYTLLSIFHCKSHVTCNDTHVTVLNCPDGQHFNPETDRCEAPCDARCDLSLAEQCGWEVTTQSEIESTYGLLN